MTTQFNPTNVRKVRDAIQAYGPEHFDITAWFRTPEPNCDDDEDWSLEFSLTQSDKIDINDCGTTACIAGHAVCLTHGELRHAEEVAEWMGVEEWVFYDDRWPNWAQEDNYDTDDGGFKMSLRLLDALLALGHCPANCEELPDPTHA